jgi:hypothetical protein
MVTKVNSTVIDGTNSNVSLANNSNLLGGVSAGQIQSQSFYSTDTWTCPTGVTRARVTVIGGGGGASTNSIGASASGGGGGMAHAVVTVTPETQYTVTIGLGGAFASGSGTRTGGTGGTSSFGNLVTATGGVGGVSSSGGGATGANGTGSTSGTLIRAGYAGLFPLLASGSMGPTTTAVVASATNGYGAGLGGYQGDDNIGPLGAVSGAVLVEWVGA